MLRRLQRAEEMRKTKNHAMGKSLSQDDREVGRIVGVSNYQVTVLLHSENRSQVRAIPHQTALVTQVDGYLLFPVTPGESVVGIIVGAYENEAVHADRRGAMALHLAKPRRVLKVNLLGQLRDGNGFEQGISSYPNLDNAAVLPSLDDLQSILNYQPKDGFTDTSLPIGMSPVYRRSPVAASFNDLLGRHLGIIGNTGSGKSWSVASIVQAALLELDQRPQEQADGPACTVCGPKVIVLDVNGEYESAFPLGEESAEQGQRRLNHIYVDGADFSLPLWLFNLPEIIRYFEASQASQVPVLERVVSTVRENTVWQTGKDLRQCLLIVERCEAFIRALADALGNPTAAYCGDKATELYDHLDAALKQIRDVGVGGLPYPNDLGEFNQIAGADLQGVKPHSIPPAATSAISARLVRLASALDEMRKFLVAEGGIAGVTADSPIPFDPRELLKDEYFLSATSGFRGRERIQEYIATLRLRINRQLTDRRLSAFGAAGGDLASTVRAMTGGDRRVVVVDCSLLAHDVLPFFCAIFARILLDLRAHADPLGRTQQPFVLVLEEAHNYLKPRREGEPFGLALARDAFERIAKEGRKYGLSLLIASQRPSDISATVLSQCANFLVHRIQNPEDIDYFAKILPLGSRDLLDQLPVLAPGDGLVMGSGFNVPARVTIRSPQAPPSSRTPKPWTAWCCPESFDAEQSMTNWVEEAAGREPEGS